MVFEVNKIYRFGGEKMKVVERSKSFVTVMNKWGEKIRRKVNVVDGCETFYPYIDKRMYGERVYDLLKASDVVGG